jgi:hypothetical protein
VDASAVGAEAGAATPGTARLVLRWLPSLVFAFATWAVFHDHGWLAWIAAVPGAYFGRAASDLATAESHRVEQGPGGG